MKSKINKKTRSKNKFQIFKRLEANKTKNQMKIQIIKKKISNKKIKIKFKLNFNKSNKNYRSQVNLE